MLGHKNAYNSNLGANTQWNFCRNGGGTFELHYSDATNVTWTGTSNVLFHVAVTFDANSAELFFNGVSRGAQDTSGLPLSAKQQKLFTNMRQYGTQGLTGSYTDVLVWQGKKSHAEIADLADPANVYLSGLIAGRPRRRWVFLGGGSTTEITGTLAGIEASGLAASVSAGTTINASLAAVELSGVAASVSAGTDVAAGVGAVAAAGLAASVSVGKMINATAGAVELSGLAADAHIGTTLTAATGAIEAAGLAATVSVSDSIESATASVAVSGLAATVSAGTTLDASTGGVELSGLAANISAGTTITGSLGTLVAAALSATVSATVGIEATTAAMEWTALSASVGTGGRIKRAHLLHGGRLSHDWGLKTGGAL
jgi:hypothetical protein